MKKLSYITTKVVGNLPSSLNLYIQLKSSWNELIGKDLENFIFLNSIKYTGKSELTVFIKILSSASLLIKNNHHKISKSISNLLGIPNTKLVFQHTSILNTLPELEPSLTETLKTKSQKPIKTIDIDFENKSLKNALEHLKTEMQNAA